MRAVQVVDARHRRPVPLVLPGVTAEVHAPYPIAPRSKRSLERIRISASTPSRSRRRHVPHRFPVGVDVAPLVGICGRLSPAVHHEHEPVAANRRTYRYHSKLSAAGREVLADVVDDQRRRRGRGRRPDVSASYRRRCARRSARSRLPPAVSLAKSPAGCAVRHTSSSSAPSSVIGARVSPADRAPPSGLNCSGARPRGRTRAKIRLTHASNHPRCTALPSGSVGGRCVAAAQETCAAIQSLELRSKARSRAGAIDIAALAWSAPSSRRRCPSR